MPLGAALLTEVGQMDEKRARTLLRAERARVESLLRNAETARHEDLESASEVGDTADHAQELTAEGMDDALLAGLKDRMAALDRAEQRLASGTFGRSVRSGEPIPDERLEADPVAELTVEEARSGL
jgi:DnaK suppressor protein